MDRSRRWTTAGATLCLGLLAGGCTIGYQARYDFALESYRRGPDAVRPLERVGDELAVDDGGLKISWAVKDFGMSVRVRNDTRSPIVARWADSHFIDEWGERHRLVVEEAWSDRHRQERTAIGPGEQVRVSLFPEDWLEPYGDPALRRATRMRGLFDAPGLRLGKSEEEIVSRASANIGKSLVAELLVDVGDAAHEYVFRFTVESVEGRALKDVI